MSQVIKTGLKEHLEAQPSAQAMTVQEGLALIEIVNQHARAITSLQGRVKQLESEKVMLLCPNRVQQERTLEPHVIMFRGLPTVALSLRH